MLAREAGAPWEWKGEIDFEGGAGKEWKGKSQEEEEQGAMSRIRARGNLDYPGTQGTQVDSVLLFSSDPLSSWPKMRGNSSAVFLVLKTRTRDQRLLFLHQ